MSQYSKRGTVIASAEGSAVGRSPAGADDAKKLALESTKRATSPLSRKSETLRFAYADPPYPGQAKRLYGNHPDYAGEVDHKDLVARLCDEYPDGWALSTGAKWLREVLLLCPDDVRVLSWVKTDAPPFTLRVQYTWEPVILHGGRPYDGGPRNVRDSLVGPSMGASFGGRGKRADEVIGQKPPWFCRWLFEVLGAGPGDEFHDLFPGSGAVLREWEAFAAQGSLLEAA